MSIAIGFWIVNEMIFNGREQQSAQWARSFARVITRRFISYISTTEYWIELMMVSQVSKTIWHQLRSNSWIFNRTYLRIHLRIWWLQWEVMLNFTYDLLMDQCSNVTIKIEFSNWDFFQFLEFIHCLFANFHWKVMHGADV